jgi:hypothetical protein
VNSEDNLFWQPGSLYVELDFGGYVVINDSLTVDGDELRPLAAALLEAADEIERAK